MARILLAEDDDSLRAFLTTSLSRAGHDVAGYGDGDSAWEALEHSSFDLLLTDIVMPGMDGWALAQQLRERNPRAYLVALTGASEDDRRERSQEAGLDIHLVKPIDPTRLELVLARAEQVVATRHPSIPA